MKGNIILACKLFLFAVILIWILCLLSVAIVVFPRFQDALTIWGLLPGIFPTALYVFYWVTFVLIGADVALRAFRLVGKWVQE